MGWRQMGLAAVLFLLFASIVTEFFGIREPSLCDVVVAILVSALYLGELIQNEQ